MEEYRPGLEGVLAAETSISFLDVDHEEIVIRGYDLIQLARQLPYLAIGYLLLNGRLPNQDQIAGLEEQLWQLAPVPDTVWAALSNLSRQGHLMDYVRTGISALGTFDPNPEDLSPTVEFHRAVRLWAQVPAIVANSYHIHEGRSPLQPRSDLAFGARFLYMITGQEPDPRAARTLETLLALYSEHEMPNSTFAARVIASTRSDMYGALTGAVASLKGSLHGGANEAAMDLLDEAGTPDRMEALLRHKLAKKERIMGFGHRVYMKKPDPRAVMVKHLLKEMADDPRGQDLLDMCEIGERVMREEKGLYPNLDYYAAPVFHLLGVPTPLFTPIFFAARTVGLVSHVMEQHQHNRLFRPRVRYVGPRGLTVGEGGDR